MALTMRRRERLREAGDLIVSENAKITIQPTESGYLFRIEGRGTLHESPAVRDFVCGAMEDGADVVLDLSECEYLDSTFLGCLVVMHQHGQREAGSFVVFADHDARSRLLRSCRLDQLLSMVDGRPEPTSDAVTLQVTQLDRVEFGQHLLETHRQLADLGGPAAETFQRIVKQLEQELKQS